MLTPERLQGPGVGRIAGLGLASRGELQIVVEDSAQLLHRVHVERAAGQLVHGGLEGCALGGQLGSDRPEHVTVDGDPYDLHAGEHPHQRSLHAIEELRFLDLRQRCFEGAAQSGQHPAESYQREPSVIEIADRGSIVLVGPGIEQEGALAFGGRAIVDRNLEEPGRQVGQAVLIHRRVEQVGGYGGVEHESGDVDTQRQQAPHQLLGVVAHDTNAVRAQPGGQRSQHVRLGHQRSPDVGSQVDAGRRLLRIEGLCHQRQTEQWRTPRVPGP